MSKKDAKLLAEVVMPILAHSPAVLKDKGLSDSGMSPIGLSRADRYYKEDELFPERLMRNFCYLILYTKKLIQRISHTKKIETESTTENKNIVTTEQVIKPNELVLVKIILNPNSIKLFRLMQVTIRKIDNVNDDYIWRLISNNSINSYFKLAKDIRPILVDSLKIINNSVYIDIKNMHAINTELVEKTNSIIKYYQNQDFKRARNGFESKPKARSLSIQKFIRKLFVDHKNMNVIRFDLLYLMPRIGDEPSGYSLSPSVDKIVSQYLPEVRRFISILKNQEDAELDSITRSLVGYMVISDYNKFKGMHFHVMLFLSSPLDQTQEDHAVNRIDAVWRNLTRHKLGFAYPCNEASGSYRFSAIARLERATWFKDADLERAIYYFARPSHYFKLDTSEDLFFKGYIFKPK